jgi:hypothetical protein
MTDVKREMEDSGGSPNKKIKSEDSSSDHAAMKEVGESDRDDGPPSLKVSDGPILPFVPPGTVGITTINDNDVLSGTCIQAMEELSVDGDFYVISLCSSFLVVSGIGRGGGTNLHPGNRQFRDLINLYRRDYLKARKNDKPSISRSIVSAPDA